MCRDISTPAAYLACTARNAPKREEFRYLVVSTNPRFLWLVEISEYLFNHASDCGLLFVTWRTRDHTRWLAFGWQKRRLGTSWYQRAADLICPQPACSQSDLFSQFPWPLASQSSILCYPLTDYCRCTSPTWGRSLQNISQL